jgi:hypothetical protein
VGREIPQYLSVEEFPEKQTPVTAFDRKNGWGKRAGKRWEGNIHDRETYTKYARKIDPKYARNWIRSMHENKRVCR